MPSDPFGFPPKDDDTMIFIMIRMVFWGEEYTTHRMNSHYRLEELRLGSGAVVFGSCAETALIIHHRM